MAYEGQDLTNYQAGNYYLPQLKYSLPYDEPTSEEDQTATGSGIPYTNAFTNAGGGGGGGGGGGPLDPYTARSSGDFVTNRTTQGSSGYIKGLEPEETYRQKIGSIIKSGIGMAIPGANFLMGMAPSREERLNATDNAFIDMQLANQEQSMHGGNLTNQDRYGFNKESMFGNYADKVKERADIARRKAKENIDDPNYKVRPIDAYYLEKEKEQEDVQKQIEFNDYVKNWQSAKQLRKTGILEKKTQDPSYDVHGGGEDMSKGDGNAGGVTLGSSTPAEGQTWHPGVGNQGGQTTQAAADKAGGSELDSPFYAGGRVGYNRGRVVNPGGYAGEDEGGILEWIKSKMGSESESNPTVFGTQDSLLNQGSIAQLQDAIKSYEALMMMGDLDEEQQADYELKMNQLQALTEGAEQKAHGGRVGFKYGGLASIL